MLKSHPNYYKLKQSSSNLLIVSHNRYLSQIKLIDGVEFIWLVASPQITIAESALDFVTLQETINC